MNNNTPPVIIKFTQLLLPYLFALARLSRCNANYPDFTVFCGKSQYKPPALCTSLNTSFGLARI